MPKPWYHPNPIRGGGNDQYTGVDHVLTEPWKEEKRNVRLVAHSELNGWGDAFQIQVGGGICYVAASGVNGHDGMTILDVKDPKNPKIVNQIVDTPAARTHKVLRINDQVLITNSELRPKLRSKYPDVIGGLRIFDNTDPFHPKFVNYVEVDGFGIHRPIYDRKRKLMYSSGFRDGFEGKILLVHDFKDPWKPELIGWGWVPESVRVLVPLAPALMVAPPARLTVTVPFVTPSCTVLRLPSTSETPIPGIASAVSSFTVCGPGTVFTGALSTAVTVIATVSTAVTAFVSVLVTVSISGPL